jgi:hypothetical protein
MTETELRLIAAPAARLRRMALAIPRRSPLTSVMHRAFHRHAGAGTHGNAEFSLAEGGCVVDAVAGHRHMFPFRAQPLDLGDLPGEFDLRLHRIKAELPGHADGSSALVAGERDEFQPKHVEFADGFRCSGVETAGGQDICELGFALREGARLVHDERGDLLQPFERLGLFHENASCAPRPTPTMMDIGVAKPSAHGQAMMRTATAPTMACASFGSGPSHIHRAKVSAETASTTQVSLASAGTK